MNLPNGKVGIVTEVDVVNLKVRVKWPTDNVVTGWLQILLFQGFYNIPAVNEQGVCLFDEEWNQGIYLGSVYTDGSGPYGDSDILGFKLGNVEIQIGKNTGTITVVSNDTVNVKATSVTLDADDVNITGKLTVTSDIKTNGKIDAVGIIKSTTDVQTATVKLNTHLHTSAAPGSPTTPPVPGT